MQPNRMSSLAPKSVRQVPKLGYKREDAAFYIGVSPSTFDSLVASGQMPQPKRFGGNVVWDIRHIDQYFEHLGSIKTNAIDAALR